MRKQFFLFIGIALAGLLICMTMVRRAAEPGREKAGQFIAAQAEEGMVQAGSASEADTPLAGFGTEGSAGQSADIPGLETSGQGGAASDGPPDPDGRWFTLKNDAPREFEIERPADQIELEKTADSFEGIAPERFGPAGLLLIPSVGIDVRLFAGSERSSDYNQQGVDFEDSAGLLNWGGEDVIGDHVNQGFSAIRNCIPGETKAYIVQEDHSYRAFLCVDAMEGTNEEEHLYGSDGHDYMNDPSDRCDLVMYTCLENWRHIWIVLWTEI